MAVITIPYGSNGAWFPWPTGATSGGTAEALKTQTATIDQPAVALLAQNGQGIWVVPQTGGVAQGLSTLVTVTLTAEDVNSDALPTLTQQFLIVGPPAPPLATQQVDAFNVTVVPSGGQAAPGGTASSIANAA